MSFLLPLFFFFLKRKGPTKKSKKPLRAQGLAFFHLRIPRWPVDILKTRQRPPWRVLGCTASTWPFLQGGGLSQLLHGGWGGGGSGRPPQCWKRLGLGEGREYVWASKEEQLFGAGRVEGVCSEKEGCARAQRHQGIRCIRLVWLEQPVSCRRGPPSRFAPLRRGTHQALHDAGRQLPLWDK